MYGNFWDKFIGVKDDPFSLSPYGIIIHGQVSRADKNKIARIYQEVNMAHYSLFCHLAGAHNKAKRVASISSPFASTKSWFNHWDAFEGFYLDLEIAMDQVYHLLDLAFLLEKKLQRTRNGRIGEIRGGPKRPDLQHGEFRQYRKMFVLERFEKIRSEISIRRNNIAHYSRSAWRRIGNKVGVPLSVRGYFPWKVGLKNNRLAETGPRTAWDLKRVELSINDIYFVLVNGFENRFADNGIEVENG